jgi:hypothetical protein
MRIELLLFLLIPFVSLETFVVYKSSPTNWILPPIFSVKLDHPSQSSSAKPSSMLKIGYESTKLTKDFISRFFYSF